MLKEKLATYSNEIESYLSKSSSFGIVLLDSDLNILDCNLGFMRLLGPHQKPVGEPLTDFLELDEKNISCNKALRLSGSRKFGMTGIFLCHIIRTDDGYFLFCEKLLLTESHALEQIGIINNELISLQREVVKKNHLLETQMTELETMNKLLDTARSEADAANRRKSEFLANMSHEIRTPMNGVIGMAQLLEMTGLSKEQQEYAELIKVSGNNLLSIINDILDLSKIEAGQIKIELTELSLQKCISEVVQMQKATILEKKLSLEVNVSDDIPPALIGDPLRIKQIILNLLGNAIKFTSQGKISISVELLEQYDNTVLVQITVQDTGIGISFEAHDKIFMPFSQEDGSTTRQYGGTGLGLSISRRYVELMGGGISVESVQGVGSCFVVTLPFSIVQNVDYSGKTLQKEIIIRNGPSLNILFAEDNPVNSTFGMTLLKKLGHNAVLVETGSDCLSALEHEKFDVVLMDIEMPVMNGTDALREIRKKELNTAVYQPVIALTAYSLRGDRERFLHDGFDGYVSKPFTINELIMEIQRVTEN